MSLEKVVREASLQKVYTDMFDILYNEGKHYDYGIAFERLLQFIVADHLPQMIPQFDDPKMAWLFDDDNKVFGGLIAIYKEHFDEIHTDTYDYLGDIYVEHQSKFSLSHKGQFLTPPAVCDLMVRMTIPEEDRKKPLNILDPCIGTGRFHIAAGKWAPNATLWGVDIDNRAIRTAFANACIHKLRVRLLHADSLVHATNIASEAGRDNWKFCNQWQSHFQELRPMSEEVLDDQGPQQLKLMGG